jgi:hypothetical protein
MGYIGNSYSQQLAQPATQFFSGNGSTTAFTLSQTPLSVYTVEVVVNNVQQRPDGSSYSINGNILTFSSAPSAGTQNIYVIYNPIVTTAGQPGYGTVGPNQLGTGAVTSSSVAAGAVGGISLDRANFTGTGAMALPSGTTAQRPATPIAGFTRFNSTTGFAEYWTGNQWALFGTVSPSTVQYLIVGGGGGGAGSEGGGGGAGGVLQNASQSITPGTVYNITVGTGGTGNTNPGGDGTSSTIFGLTAVGGGGGGSVNSNNARAGGSGGGGGRTSSIRTFGGAGTGGQGNTGGTGFENIAGYAAAGGGGASAVGNNGSGLVGGAGGAGTANLISGSTIGQLSGVTYYVGGGGGGGGGNNNGNPSNGAGGLGGGGAGGLPAGSATGGVAGTPFTGGGGGGGGQGNTGANGGSGVVVIAHPAGYKDAVATGTYSRTTNAGNTIYTFTGPGTITF